MGNKIVALKPSKNAVAISLELQEAVGFNPLVEVFEIGNKINAVSTWLAEPDIAKILEKLEGSPAGFLTDKKNGQKYDAKIRAQALVDCLSQGARVVGNELNIISGRGMLVKNFYKRMLDHLGHENYPSHACDYEMKYWVCKVGAPTIEKGIITMPVSITGKWKVKSTKKMANINWDTVITIKYGGSYDTIDNATGKVERRAWKQFYAEHSGILYDDEVQEIEGAVTEPAVGTKPLTEGAQDITDAFEEAEVITPEQNDASPKPETQPAQEKAVLQDAPEAEPQVELELDDTPDPEPPKKKAAPTSGPTDEDIF